MPIIFKETLGGSFGNFSGNLSCLVGHLLGGEVFTAVGVPDSSTMSARPSLVSAESTTVGANRRLQEARRRLKKAPRVANALDHIPIMENEFDKAALDRRLARARGKVRIVLRARTFHGGRTAN